MFCCSFTRPNPLMHFCIREIYCDYNDYHDFRVPVENMANNIYEQFHRYEYVTMQLNAKVSWIKNFNENLVSLSKHALPSQTGEMSGGEKGSEVREREGKQSLFLKNFLNVDSGTNGGSLEKRIPCKCEIVSALSNRNLIRPLDWR